MTTLDALIARHGAPALHQDRRRGLRGRGAGRLVVAGPGAVVRIHHHPARCCAGLHRRAARRSAIAASAPRSAKASLSSHERKFDGVRDRRLARGPAGGSQFRGHLCDAGLTARHGSRCSRRRRLPRARIAARGRADRSRSGQCQRADAVRGKRQRLSPASLSAEVRQFTIVAEHPAYAGTIVADRSAPDFRNCDMSGDPVFKAEPRRVTLYETGDLQLIGYTFSSFWRPNTVPVRVGKRVENGLHLLQLFTKYRAAHRGGAGGLSRRRLLARPAAAAAPSRLQRLRLVVPGRPGGDRRRGPSSTSRRSCSIPATLTFRLAFARGGGASLHVDGVDEEQIALEIKLDTTAVASRAVRRAALDVRHRDQCRRRAGRPGAPPAAEPTRRPGDGFPPRHRPRVLGRPPPAVAPQHERAGHDLQGFWGCTVARMSEATSGTAVVKVLEPAPHIAALMRTTKALRNRSTRSTPPHLSR